MNEVVERFYEPEHYESTVKQFLLETRPEHKQYQCGMEEMFQDLTPR